MGKSKSVLKWLAALGTGVLVAVGSYIVAHLGNGPDLGDPTLNGILALIMAKLSGYITSKIPADPSSPTPPSSSSTYRP